MEGRRIGVIALGHDGRARAERSREITKMKRDQEEFR
jgi:hypothetical protein